MPRRADIDPLDLQPLLGWISLVEIRTAPPRFQIRIAANNLNDPFGTRNGAGLDVIRSATYRASFGRHWRHVAETGEPRFDEFTLTFAACRLVYWRMALPLGEGRITPNMILIGSYFADPIQQKHFLDTFDRATGRASAPS